MKFTRKEIWQHNGFLGTCAFAQKGLLMIAQSRTATPQAKALAREIVDDLYILREQLKVKANAN